MRRACMARTEANLRDEALEHDWVDYAAQAAAADGEAHRKRNFALEPVRADRQRREKSAPVRQASLGSRGNSREARAEAEQDCLREILLVYMLGLRDGEHEERERGHDAARRDHIPGAEGVK